MALCTNNLTYLQGEYNWGYCGEIQTVGVENVFLPTVFGKEYIFLSCRLREGICFPLLQSDFGGFLPSYKAKGI